MLIIVISSAILSAIFIQIGYFKSYENLYSPYNSNDVKFKKIDKIVRKKNCRKRFRVIFSMTVFLRQCMQFKLVVFTSFEQFAWGTCICCMLLICNNYLFGLSVCYINVKN